MEGQLIAKSIAIINAPIGEVWAALLTPKIVQEVMSGMQPQSNWEVGGELRWVEKNQEESNNQTRGIITEIIVNKRFAYTFYYSGYGYPDEPRYYNYVVYNLQEEGQRTVFTVEQGDFSVFKEGQIYQSHTQTFWDAAVQKLMELTEADSFPKNC